MRPLVWTAVSVVMINAVQVSAANNPITLDLHSDRPVAKVKPGDYDEYTVRNALPFEEYDFKTEDGSHPAPTADLAAARKTVNEALATLKEAKQKAAANPGTTLGAMTTRTLPMGQTSRTLAEILTDDCDDLERAMDALKGAKTPKDVVDAKLEVQKHLSDNCPLLSDAARTLLDLTTRHVAPGPSLDRGDFTTLTVTQRGASQSVSKKFDTGPTGVLVTHLVVGALPNEDEHYFLRELTADESSAAGGAKYEIKREHDRRGNDYLAAALFTFRPSDRKQKFPSSWRSGDWSGSWAAGIGLEGDRPLLLAGYQLGYAEAFGIAFGFAYHEQQVLSGRYEENDKVKDNLTPEQLIQKGYQWNTFVAITWRR